MNAKHILTNLLPLFALVVFAGCEVEFSPNADWQDIPVVYGLLDQDDDTTFIRVERCFLPEGNIRDYGSISDSLNYPQGTIEVSLLAYRNGRLLGSEVLQYTEREHLDGAFAAMLQPLYYTVTPLDSNLMYKVEVHRVADGVLLATSDSIALIRQTENTLITSPSNNTRFGFHQYSGGTPVCTITWNPLAGARRYQPIVRFYYGELGDTHYVDLPCNSVASGNNDGPISSAYPRNAFLNSLREAFVEMGDTVTPKQYLEYVDIYLTACDENLGVYMMSVNSGVSINQTTDTYTNIRGGVGIFAARRTHLHKYLLADNSMVPLGAGNPGLHAYIRALDIGFE